MKQAVTPGVAAFFFMLQIFELLNGRPVIGACARILQCGINSISPDGGFMSAFRFQTLLSVSIPESYGFEEEDVHAKYRGIFKIIKNIRERPLR
ncbi:hypothetical protein [Sphingobium limneticum]|jgi:hypothetical protein|uniref:hypothetical protein n=1 Tax=Sphingobium limneticum TaxID=1007511 RepID=UPI00123DC271|nr:hypothetical protein [Sphingobium limneticum]